MSTNRFGANRISAKKINSAGLAIDISWNDRRHVLDYLVVAGGGAGDGGAGGAGGLIYAVSARVELGVTYTVTVGAGGMASAAGDAATSGNNSSFVGSTAIGGGAGRYTLNSVSGGSGSGGAHGGKIGGSGTAGQGNAGGNGSAGNSSGGGGGAGGVGGNAPSNTVGGAGGIGLQYSISGTATYYAGGGGGGCPTGGTGGTGGNGGGGNGASAGAGNGTANTGGGGGGIYQTYPAGNGGSGIVILRFLSTVTVSSTTGSPTITTDGSYKVYKFTSSGTITF